jgi:uncharacterized delta-60 repeat protein
VLVQCFGPRGALAGRYLGGSGVARAVAIQPDGRAVVAGASGGMFVERFPYALATAVAVQADGRIVLAGRWQDPAYGVTSGWVERLTASGQDDASFAGGQAIYSYAAHGAGYASLNAVALQADGKMIAAGSDLSPPPGVNLGPSAAFVRLNADGTPDAGFGSAGIEKLSAGTFTPDPYGAYGVASPGAAAWSAPGRSSRPVPMIRACGPSPDGDRPTPRALSELTPWYSGLGGSRPARWPLRLTAAW